MSTIFYYKGQPYDTDNLHQIGQGGEGNVYTLEKDGETVVKIYHGSDKLNQSIKNLSQDEQQQRTALEKIQDKLRNVPADIPEKVAKPKGVAFNTDRKKIVGFGMTRIDGYSLNRYIHKKEYRQSREFLVKILINLHVLVQTLHQRGIIVGDFTPDNVIVNVKNGFPSCHLVDFDSMKWGSYEGTGFQWDMTDPLLFGKPDWLNPNQPMKPFTKDSDWYSFTAITMKVLTRVGPYDGVIDGQSKHRHLKGEERLAHRLSVFSPHVNYPKAGIPLGEFSPQLTNYWKEVFIEDLRGTFPFQLLMQLKS